MVTEIYYVVPVAELFHIVPILVLSSQVPIAQIFNILTGLILGLHPANERRRYFVTTSLIGWAQT